MGAWVQTPVLAEGDVSGAIDAAICGEILVASILASAQEGRRPPQLIREDGLDHILVHVVRSGELAFGFDDGPRASAGALLVVDMSQPARVVCSDVRLITLAFPRRLLAGSVALDSVHGYVPPADAPAVLTLNKLLSMVQATLGGMSERARNAMCRTITAVCADALEGADEFATRHPAEIGRRARNLIAARYVEADLSPQKVAESLGVSRATLYRAYAKSDRLTIRERIEQTRLRAALARLSVISRMEDVEGIAKACGFGSLRRLRDRVEGATRRPLEDLVEQDGVRQERAVSNHLDGAKSLSWWLSDRTAFQRDVRDSHGASGNICLLAKVECTTKMG